MRSASARQPAASAAWSRTAWLGGGAVIDLAGGGAAMPASPRVATAPAGSRPRPAQPMRPEASRPRTTRRFMRVLVMRCGPRLPGDRSAGGHPRAAGGTIACAARIRRTAPRHRAASPPQPAAGSGCSSIPAGVTLNSAASQRRPAQHLDQRQQAEAEAEARRGYRARPRRRSPRPRRRHRGRRWRARSGGLAARRPGEQQHPPACPIRAGRRRPGPAPRRPAVAAAAPRAGARAAGGRRRSGRRRAPGPRGWVRHAAQCGAGARAGASGSARA